MFQNLPKDLRRRFVYSLVMKNERDTTKSTDSHKPYGKKIPLNSKKIKQSITNKKCRKPFIHVKSN